MKIECLILERSHDDKSIVISLNQLMRSSCGKLGWVSIGMHAYNRYQTVRKAYLAALEWKPGLPIISKVKQDHFTDANHHDLFEGTPEELEKAYVRAERRHNKAQHKSNVRSAALQTHPS